MKLEDYLKEGSLFTPIYNQLEASLQIIESERLDNMLLIEHGDKTVFNKLENKSLDQVAGLIVTKYQKDWLDLLAVENSAFKVGAVNIREVVDNTLGNETRTNNRDDLNKVSGYNSDELIVNDGVTSTNAEASNNDRKRDVLETKYNLNELDNQLLLRSKNNIIRRMVIDVSNFITLSIY